MMRLFVFPALALASVPAAQLAAAAPGPASGVYLVLAPPWQDAEGVIAAAGGRLVGPRSAAFGHLAAADGADFAARLRASGFLVFDGQQVAGLCGGTA